MAKAGWAVAAACLVAAAGAGWGWWSERTVHRSARLELAKAQARLSARVPPAPATSVERAQPCLPDDVDDDRATSPDLSALLAAAERERDEYRAGLEAAVAELNRVRSAHQADLASANLAASAGARPRAAPRSRVVPLLDPDLTPLGDRVMVSGKVYNTGSEDVDVNCTLELLRDGQRIDSARFSLRVAAGATQPYTHHFRFPTGGTAATYSARLSIE